MPWAWLLAAWTWVTLARGPGSHAQLMLENHPVCVSGLQGLFQLSMACGPLVAHLFILLTKTLLTSLFAASLDALACDLGRRSQ